MDSRSWFGVYCRQLRFALINPPRGDHSDYPSAVTEHRATGPP